MRRKLFPLAIMCFVLGFSLVVSVKADTLMWSQTYGEPDNEGANSVVKTTDGGYAVAGIIHYLFTGNYGVLLVKTDIYGNMEWNKTYGSFLSGSLSSPTVRDYSCAMVATSDGGYALTVVTDSDFWLVKTDEFGNMEWNKTDYGTRGYDWNPSLLEASEGGYIIAGTTWSSDQGSHEFLLIKTNEFGNIHWKQTYGGTSDASANAVVETFDGGYAIAGGNLLIKTNASGNMEWNTTYGNVRYNSLVETSDGGYALAGCTKYFGGDSWLIKTDEFGNMEWNQTYGNRSCQSLIETSDRGYILAGLTDSFYNDNQDFWLAKTDASGNSEWSRTYGGPYHDWANSVTNTSDGGYAVAGITLSFGAGGYDFWVIKTDEYGIVPEGSSLILTSLLLATTLVIVVNKRKLFHPR